MYGGYNTTTSPPLPDIIGPYYTTGLTDMYAGGLPTTAYYYDTPTMPTIGTGYYASGSPIRRRRYSIAGLPSATMMNDYYGMYPSAFSGLPMAGNLQHASSSNLVNLLNETHKSISRSSQILNQHARMQQATQTLNTPHYASGGVGRVISSYPSLHPGGEISPPYFSDTNLLQMSNSFSSQPNMYFQTYTPQTHVPQRSSGPVLRPAYSVSNLNMNAGGLTSPYAASSAAARGGYATGGVASSSYPYSQSLLNHSDLPYIMQQRQLLNSLHASNPAISQYYQQQLPHYLQHYAQQQQQPATNSNLAYNLQQQFAGTQNYQYGGGGGLGMHPSAQLHQNVAQQLNPNHQFHVHSQQNHMQTHPLAGLGTTSATPFGVQLTSSEPRHDNLSYLGLGLGQQQQPPPTHHHHHPHVHHPTAPHTHHLHHATSQQQQQQQQPLHHHSPYTKIDLDYPKMPQEHKRQVSFKFDVDQLSLDS